MNSRHRLTLRNRALWPRPLLMLAVMFALITSAAPGPVAGQEAPRPIQRLASAFSDAAPSAEYDLVEQILDFPPGAATRFHTHPGKAFFTVIEGQLTYEEGAHVSEFGPGQSFTEPIGVFHTLKNNGGAPARVFSSFLLPPGEPQVVAHPDSAAPEVAPR